jgi:hypothetical protein
MIDPAKEREYREEAARLAQLPKAEQRAIIAWHRDIAANPKVKKADRQLAADKAEALERFLEKKKRKQQKP